MSVLKSENTDYNVYTKRRMEIEPMLADKFFEKFFRKLSGLCLVLYLLEFIPD
jgi:hypothetical protein